jgi:hypothetical protein
MSLVRIAVGGVHDHISRLKEEKRKMWTKAKVSAEFDEQTIKLFNKIILMRRERGIENNKGFNEMMQEFFQKEIQLMRDEHPTMEDINERNILRILDLQNKKIVYCPMYHQYIQNIMVCNGCHYGHMLECHYPYTCDTKYCQHYPDEKTINNMEGGGVNDVQ